MRTVKVTDIMAGEEKIDEMAEKLCRACQLDERARVHERAARKQREQAALIRRNRPKPSAP